MPRWRLGDDPRPLARLLRRGGVVAIPTGSSYGLAADPHSAEGVERIYRLKERERGKPLPLVVADLEQVAALGLDPAAPELAAAARLWPAPLTVVSPLRAGFGSPPAAAGGTTLAVRVPAHEPLRAVLHALGFGLTATSANLSGEPPLVDALAVEELLARLESESLVGASLGGDGSPLGSANVALVEGPLGGHREPSTVVAWNSARGGFDVLRPGRVTAEHILTTAEPDLKR